MFLQYMLLFSVKLSVPQRNYRVAKSKILTFTYFYNADLLSFVSTTKT
jgi:hypothetical protein